MDRGRRKEEVDRAYEIQARAAVRGAAQYGAVGLGLAAIGHYTWPSFKCVVVISKMSIKRILIVT